MARYRPGPDVRTHRRYRGRPHHRSTWYIGVGSGGVWKTINRGTTWTSVFDGQGSYSIGAITVDPNNHNVIWVGTGENVSGRHVGYGDGVYKSLDGGTTWKNMGLKNSEHIGMIASTRVTPMSSMSQPRAPSGQVAATADCTRRPTAVTNGNVFCPAATTPASAKSTSTRATRT